MPNDRFDLSLWQKRWGDSFLAKHVPNDSGYQSPFDAVVHEYMLSKHTADKPHIETVPVDYFVLGLGESSNRAATKIGGVPYLPKCADWPHESGEPIQFYFQVNFSDSRDLVGKLPGDILLVFADFEPCMREDMTFMWVDEDPSIDLIPPAQASVLQGDELFVPQPLYTQIHRTTELRTSDSFGARCANRIGGIAAQKDVSFLFRLETIGIHANRLHPWLNRGKKLGLQQNLWVKFRIYSGNAGRRGPLPLDPRCAETKYFMG